MICPAECRFRFMSSLHASSWAVETLIASGSSSREQVNALEEPTMVHSGPDPFTTKRHRRWVDGAFHLRVPCYDRLVFS